MLTFLSVVMSVGTWAGFFCIALALCSRRALRTRWFNIVSAIIFSVTGLADFALYGYTNDDVWIITAGLWFFNGFVSVVQASLPDLPANKTGGGQV